MRFTLLAIALLLPNMPLFALPPQSDHAVLQAVPVPGKVVIDGKLDDGEWDRSAVLYSYPVRDLRERYAVRVHAMWDIEALYLGLEFRDPTPMINNVDAAASPHIGWQSDGFQARFHLGNQIYHVTAWYSTFSDRPVVHVHLGDANNFAREVQKVFLGQGTRLDDPSGLRMAFRKNADNRGYVQELRLPWAILDPKFRPKAGSKIGFVGEYFWGGPSGIRWPQVLWSDPVNQKIKQRIVIYQNPAAWGELEFLPKGNLPRKDEVDSEVPLLQGPLPIRVQLPAEASHFSLVIDDAKGRRIRNLVSHGRVSDYLMAGKPGSGKGRVVEVPWDGRQDGAWDPARSLFLGEVVPAGTYTVRGLYHSGVGVNHAGSFCNPGNPPWPTADGSGAWLSDHSPPSAVACAPANSKGKAQIFIGSEIYECGTSLIGVSAEGRKVWQWTRGTAPQLAANASHLFVGMLGGSTGMQLTRLDPNTGREAPFGPERIDVPLPGRATGLAAGKSLVAASIASKNSIALYTAQEGRPVRDMAVPSPGKLVFSPDEKTLVGISGKQLFRVDLATGKVRMFSAEGVRTPTALAFSSKGELLVADAAEHLVRVFPEAAAGVKPLGTLGEPGGHGPGKWNPRRLGDLVALAVQPGKNGDLVWIVESGPVRRVSVWEAGKNNLVREYVGGTGYQGWDGMMSDDRPDWGYAQGAIYSVDLKSHQYQVKELMGVPPPPPGSGKYDLFHIGLNPPFRVPVHFVSQVSGKEVDYLCSGGSTANCVFMRRNGYWSCVAALGHARSIGQLRWPKEFPPAPSPEAVFCFNDLNGDGYVSADEITWAVPGKKNVLHAHLGWGYRPDRDLAWYCHGLAYRPVRFAADGAPIYDVGQPEKLPRDLAEIDHEIYRTATGYVASRPVKGLESHLNVIHGQHELVGFDGAGRRMWSYPNFWISVHGGFSAPMAQPGVIMGMLKYAGFPRLDDKHGLIALWGNTGQIFLLRCDGVYVGELFTDQRMAPNSLPDSRDCIDVPINDTSLGGEPFAGWVGRQRDGKVRVSYGHTDVRVAEVTGLESIRSIPSQTIVVSAQQVAQCQAFRPRLQAEPVTRETTISRGKLPTEATAFEAAEALVLRRGKEEVARILLRYDDKHLQAAFRVWDTTPLQNAGSPGPLLFKSGDSVNLFVAPEGKYAEGEVAGVRVLAANLATGPAAVIYRPNGPGDRSFTFESPVRKLSFRHVAVEPSIATTIMPGSSKTDYLATLSIPWTQLGLQPRPGMKVRLDVAVLFSDGTGTQTGQRIHWADRQTNVVNDVPSEAEFFPARWGTATLR